MNLKIGLIFRLLVEFFITLLMFIMLVQGDFLIKMAIYPFIIILLSDIIKNIIFLKRGIVDNLFFSKVSAIGFFLFIFQLLSYITFLFISSKVYFLLITILPFWIFTVVYFKKKIFDNYDVVLECLKNGRFINLFNNYCFAWYGFYGIGWLAFYLISGSFSIIETLIAFSSNYLAAYFLLASFWFIGIMVIIASFTNKK